MIREVNLIDHLPLFVQEFREIQNITSAENPEFQSAMDSSEIVKNNMFVMHTDEAGVERYEKMLGLTASKNDNLSNRRARVLAQYTNSVVYTLRGLIERLNVILGAENYTLKLIPNKYEINIHLHLRVKSLLDTVASIFAETIPANMCCVYNINYNTHEILAKYPRYLLMQFTHQELYDLPIEDHISSTCDNITNYTMDSFENVSCENMANYGMRKV